MRRLILAAAGLALLVPAGLSQAVLAQTTPAPAAGPAAQAAPAPAGQPGGSGAPGPVAGGPAVPPPPGGARGPGGPGGGPGMAPPPPPPPSRAAHFHLQRGDAVVDVKCAEDDTAKACGDLVNAMLDKLAAMPAPTRN